VSGPVPKDVMTGRPDMPRISFASWTANEPVERNSGAIDIEVQFNDGHGDSCEHCRIGFTASRDQMREIAKVILANIPDVTEVA
jgi:hypothetical protein